MLPSNQQKEFEQFVLNQPIEKQTNTIYALVKTVTQLQSEIARLKAVSVDNLEIKTTTGDYAAGTSWNGRRVLNTFDNTYKIFAEGAWRQIIAY